MIVRFVVVALLMVMSAGRVLAGTISGYVRDDSSAETLPYANAVLRRGDVVFGVLSNGEGYFALKSIPAGSYSLVVSYIGYKSFRDSVTVSDVDEQRVEIALEPETIVGAEIVVEARRG